MLLHNNLRCNCRYRCGGKPRLTMYNYGSQRVGNAAFARAYNAAVPDSWRVTNKLDVIPRVPRLLGYCHVGNSASITPDGAFELNGALAQAPLLLLATLRSPALSNQAQQRHEHACVAKSVGLHARADEKMDVFKEGHNAEDVLPKLLRAAQERSAADGADLAALVQFEIEFLRTLVSGNALSEHMVCLCPLMSCHAALAAPEGFCLAGALLES